MSITNASLVIDLIERAAKHNHHHHRVRMAAVLSETTVAERVAMILTHTVQIFNEADSIDENEKYLVMMIEAMLEANIDDAAEIAEYAVEYFEAQSKAPEREYYPHMILALLNVSVRRAVANNWKAGERIPRSLGLLFRGMAIAGHQREIRVSELMTGQLSQALTKYVGMGMVAKDMIEEIGDLSMVPKCLHQVFGDLTHRLFGTLSFSARFACLRVAITEPVS